MWIFSLGIAQIPQKCDGDKMFDYNYESHKIEDARKQAHYNILKTLPLSFSARVEKRVIEYILEYPGRVALVILFIFAVAMYIYITPTHHNYFHSIESVKDDWAIVWLTPERESRTLVNVHTHGEPNLFLVPWHNHSIGSLYPDGIVSIFRVDRRYRPFETAYICIESRNRILPFHSHRYARVGFSSIRHHFYQDWYYFFNEGSWHLHNTVTQEQFAVVNEVRFAHWFFDDGFYAVLQDGHFHLYQITTRENLKSLYRRHAPTQARYGMIVLRDRNLSENFKGSALLCIATWDEIIPFGVHRTIEILSPEIVYVSSPGEQGLYNPKTGEMIFELGEYSLYNFKYDGLMRISQNDGTRGIIDTSTWEMVVPFQEKPMRLFPGHVMAVRTDNGWRFEPISR